MAGLFENKANSAQFGLSWDLAESLAIGFILLERLFEDQPKITHVSAIKVKPDFKFGILKWKMTSQKKNNFKRRDLEEK